MGVVFRNGSVNEIGPFVLRRNRPAKQNWTTAMMAITHENFKKRKSVTLIGGPGDGVTILAPPCYPCRACDGVIWIVGPESPSGAFYRGRPGNVTRADYLPGGWQKGADR